MFSNSEVLNCCHICSQRVYNRQTFIESGNNYVSGSQAAPGQDFIGKFIALGFLHCVWASTLLNIVTAVMQPIFQRPRVRLQTCCFDDILNDFHWDLLITDKSHWASLIEKLIKFLGSRNHFLLRIPGVGEWDVFHTFLRLLPLISICK